MAVKVHTHTYTHVKALIKGEKTWHEADFNVHLIPEALLSK